SANGDDLADADLTSDDAEQRFGDAKADAREGFLMGDAVEQVLGRDALGKRQLGKPKWVAHDARVMPSAPHRPDGRRRGCVQMEVEPVGRGTPGGRAFGVM